MKGKTFLFLLHFSHYLGISRAAVSLYDLVREIEVLEFGLVDQDRCDLMLHGLQSDSEMFSGGLHRSNPIIVLNR